MNNDIREQLKAAFLAVYPDDQQRYSSKTEVIREMFDDINEARNHGVKVKLLVQILNNKGYKIKEGEFCQILYRIRKERGLSPQKKSNINTSPPVLLAEKQPGLIKATEPAKENINYADEWDAIMENYRNGKTPQEQYIALGGDPRELDGHPPRKQREMCTTLRMRLSSQYKLLI